MTEEKKKKGIFDKAIDAISNRDEKAALEEAKLAAEKAKKEAEYQKGIAAASAKVAAERAAKEKEEAEKKALAEKAAAAKAAADKATAEKWAAQSAAAAAKVRKGTVNVKSLRIRKDHTTESLMVGGLVFGETVTILETQTDGKDTWAKIGPDQWAAMIYNKEVYIKETA